MRQLRSHLVGDPLVAGSEVGQAIGEGGWMLLVVCAVKAARDMSWRDALAAGRPPVPTVERIEQPPGGGRRFGAPGDGGSGDGPGGRG